MTAEQFTHLTNAVGALRDAFNLIDASAVVSQEERPYYFNALRSADEALYQARYPRTEVTR